MTWCRSSAGCSDRCMQYTLPGCTGVRSHHVLLPIPHSQTSSLVKQSLPCSVCVFLNEQMRVKGEISCCSGRFVIRMHCIVIISLVFQLPVTFSDLLIFSMIFFRIRSITPRHNPHIIHSRFARTHGLSCYSNSVPHI